MTTTPDLNRLRRCRRIAAVAVQMHGEWVLPIFERLDEEVRNAEKREALLRRAAEIAKRRDT